MTHVFVARVWRQDKRITVLGLFHESREPWLLKDVEKAASKRGVVFQAVKDVVQQLVDDDLVHVDKVGSSNWYWAFPGEASAKANGALARAEEARDYARAEIAQLEKAVAKEMKQNPMTDEHKELSSALAAAKSENSTLKSELEKFSSSDPAVIDAMRDGAKIAKQAANVWTDNIFMMKSWVDSKMGDKDSVKQFFKSEGDINLDTFDYVE